MKETSVKRKGSSLREGHGVDRRLSDEASRSFWRGSGVEGRESSRVSASSRTKGSEVMACDCGCDCDWIETLVVLGLMNLFLLLLLLCLLRDLKLKEEEGIEEGL